MLWNVGCRDIFSLHVESVTFKCFLLDMLKILIVFAIFSLQQSRPSDCILALFDYPKILYGLDLYLSPLSLCCLKGQFLSREIKELLEDII